MIISAILTCFFKEVYGEEDLFSEVGMAPSCSSQQHFVLPAVAPACCSQHIKNECEAVYSFCKGFGWNEAKLVHILGRKNAAQRNEMRDLFFAMYKEDLSKILQAEVNGRLQKAMILWMHDPAQRDAVIARTALQSSCPDFRALTEILCARTQVEILKIRQAYYSLYKTCLEEDIAQETVGAHQKLLFTLAKAYRYASKDVNNNNAKCDDAKRLYDSGEGRIGINEGAIIKILSERNLDHLRATFGYYKQLYGRDILKGLRKKTCGDFGHALRVIIKCIYFPAKYFAKVLHISLEGFGTQDDELTRVMVTRAEVDMAQIKRVYHEKYGMSLEQAIQRHTCGSYRDFLLQLACTGAICQGK